MKFSIGIAEWGKRPHAACFEDVAFAMAATLRRLGHETHRGYFGVDDEDCRKIMFGVNNGTWTIPVPSDWIIFNSEQLSAVDDPERYMQNRAMYRESNCVVWDYSKTNVEQLQKFGIARAVHCPIGYIESMTTIENKPVAEQDVDVLFYGSTNPYRLKILDGLDAAGLKVKRLFGVYGKERDAWIARSKIVLNLHHYQRGVFEIFRVSHLVANNKCVVSEGGGVDEELNGHAKRMTWAIDYDGIVDACVRLARDDEMREIVAQSAHRYFRSMKFADHIAKALEQS